MSGVEKPVASEQGSSKDNTTNASATEELSTREREISDQSFSSPPTKSERKLLTWITGRTIPPVPDYRTVSPHATANYLSRITWWWLTPLLKTGYLRGIERNDLWIIDEHLRNKSRQAVFDRKYRELIQAKNPSRFPEFWSIAYTLRFQIMNHLLVTSLWLGFSVCMPLLSRALINYVEESYYISTSRGKIAGMAIGFVLMTIAQQWLFVGWQYHSKFLAESVRCMTVTAVYRKSLRLSPMARKQYSSSKLTSMISLDVNRLMMASRFSTIIVLVPFLLGGTLGVLIYNLGVSSLVGVALIFAGLGLSGGMSALVGKYRGKSIPFADKRIGILRETMQNFRIVKFYGWEDSFLDMVRQNRSKEAYYFKVLGALRGIMESFLVSVPLFAGVVTFAVRSVLGHSLSPALVFPSLTLFELFIPMTAIITMGLAAAADAYKSVKRIQGLFSAENDTEYVEFLPEDSGKVAVEIENGFFSWGQDDDSGKDSESETLPSKDSASAYAEKQAELKRLELSVETASMDSVSIKDFARKTEIEADILQSEAIIEQEGEQLKGTKEASTGGFQAVKFPGLNGINMSVHKGEFILVMGSIGSGKTTLLSAMAGVTRKISGAVRVSGRMSCCLELWSQNATVRENILFGHEYDSARYENTLKICGLEDDLALLPKGDMTEIGERGITLSGGQRARISLARAVYDDGDVMLFDDILAAVDSRVSNYILNDCILGHLQSKTRIMATHNLSLIQYADRIAFLDGKGNCTFDTPENLSAGLPLFTEFTRLVGKGAVTKESQRKSDEKKNKPSKENEEVDKLVQEEGRAHGRVPARVLATFIKAGGGVLGWGIVPLIAVLIATTATSQVMMSIFLSWWTANRFQQALGFYAGIYVLILVLYVLFNLMLQLTITVFCFTSASKLHNRAVANVFRAPMSFFDATPLGRIMSRFTEDTQNLDTTTYMIMSMFLNSLGGLFGPIITIFVYIPYVAVAVAPIFLLAIIFLNFYRKSAREIKRYDALNRSAMFAHTSETFSGISTILSYSRQQTFTERLYDRIDDMNSAFFLTVSNQSWLTLRLMFTCSIVSFMTTLMASERVFPLNASSVGLLLSILSEVTQSMIMIMPFYADLENEMNSVERLDEFGTRIPNEAPYEIPDKKPSQDWPNQGLVEFKNACLKYREHLPYVLDHLSFASTPGEKIGICGRTGAGKSTVLTALFRINELNEGSIFIDGIDISTIGLRDLRSKLSIIPQEPVLFQGTIRSNLDPFNERSDVELWDALRRSGLIRAEDLEKQMASERPATNAPQRDDPSKGKPHSTRDNSAKSSMERHKFHLDEEVEAEGANFSLGERQLLTLARALVRRSKIIVLDEATASVDYETDQRVQLTIANEFADCTIMCIAHRLKTIIHYDRILVLDKGKLEAFDKPYTLFQQDGSLFRDMCHQAGIGDEDFPR